MDYKDYLKGKKITVMGLGLLGRGVGDAAFLASLGANLIVTDLKSRYELKSSLRKLKRFKNIKYVLGKHRPQDFRDRDVILKAAGVPLGSPYIAEARKHNIPVRMSADLFAQFAGIPIIGITGTRGKTTTTYLIKEILESDGKKVLLGGNVKGVSTLSLLPKANGADIAVFELDSWQLQGFGEAKISPSIAVLTNFMDDHLNYYASTSFDRTQDRSLSTSRKKYFSDKANIFLYQKKDGIFVTSRQVLRYITKNRLRKKIKSRIIVSSGRLEKGFSTRLIGAHNIENASIAVATARALGIQDAVIKKALRNFKGVSGRLELIRVSRGIRIYNDTTSTTPDAAIAALKALDARGKKNIILILGGADKGLDMSKLLKEIPRYCKKVLFLAGTGTDRIKNAFPQCTIYRTLSGAVKDAMREAKSGDVVLFSPAFASFGMFKNEFDRGEKFNKLVSKLK